MEKNVQTDSFGYIKTNQEGMTSKAGIFAAGDCIDREVQQLTTAVYEGTIAALNSIKYLEQLKS